jgi:hypothetical protein
MDERVSRKCAMELFIFLGSVGREWKPGAWLVFEKFEHVGAGGEDIRLSSLSLQLPGASLQLIWKMTRGRAGQWW